MAHLTPEDRERLDEYLAYEEEERLMDGTNWKPERKVVAAAIATIVMFVVGLVWPSLDVPAGIEATIATIIAYLIPNAQ